MRAVYILLAAAAVILLLAQVRIGAGAEYSQQGLRAVLRIGPLRIPVFPLKDKTPKEKKSRKKEKSAKEKKPAEQKPKGGTVELVLEFLPLVLETVGKLRRKLRMDQLEMELTIGAEDPADAALRYGQANALLGSLWQPITQTFHVVDGHAHVGVDFNAERPALYLKAALSLTVGQAAALGVMFGIKALGILLRLRRKQKTETEQREAV